MDALNYQKWKEELRKNRRGVKHDDFKIELIKLSQKAQGFSQKIINAIESQDKSKLKLAFDELVKLKSQALTVEIEKAKRHKDFVSHLELKNIMKKYFVDCFDLIVAIDSLFVQRKYNV